MARVTHHPSVLAPSLPNSSGASHLLGGRKTEARRIRARVTKCLAGDWGWRQHREGHG